MFKKKTLTLETKQRLSKSMLWDAQTHFYAKQGINAWVNQVPYYITSNPFIADSYARIVLRFLQDSLRNGKIDPEKPIYILELGTGSGKFSYYITKKLFELQASLRLEQLKICYVMSDFTMKNIEFWQSHDAFAHLIADGRLDFCQLDVEADDQPMLIQAKQPLKSDNPMIAFVNYLFDSTRADAFYVENKKLHESLTTIKCPATNLKNGQPTDLEKLDIQFTHKPIKLPYYDDAPLNDILAHYTNHIADKIGFLIPTSCIAIVNRLQQLTNGNLLLLSTDKGYSHIEDQNFDATPHIAIHNSFSLMVNFDVIGRYVEANGGCYLKQAQHEGIQTCAFICGQQATDLPETTTAFARFADDFGTASYFSIHQSINKHHESLSLAALTHYLKLSNWDPYVYMGICRRINTLIGDANLSLKNCLIEGLQKLTEQFYFMPDDSDPLFEVGLFFHTIEDYPTALSHYHRSLKHFGRPYWTVYNLGLCYNQVNQLEEALKWFKLALPLMPDKAECQKHIDQATEALSR